MKIGYADDIPGTPLKGWGLIVGKKHFVLLLNEGDQKSWSEWSEQHPSPYKATWWVRRSREIPDDEVPDHIWALIGRLGLEGKL